MKSVLMGLIIGSTCLSGMAASFDCSRAMSASERLICGDAELSAQDDRLAANVKAARERAVDVRLFNREQVQAWKQRQLCADLNCVRNWYATRLAVFSDASSALTQGSAVNLVAHVQSPIREVGNKLGMDIPVTKAEFIKRYGRTGGQCGVSPYMPNLTAASSTAVSDCWSETNCPSYSEELKCTVVRTAYDANQQLVLFMIVLKTVSAETTVGTRAMGKVAGKFNALNRYKHEMRDVPNGSLFITSGTDGTVKFEANVLAAEGEQQVGIFWVGLR